MKGACESTTHAPRAGGTELGELEPFAQQEDAGDADNAKHLGSKQDDPKFPPRSTTPRK